MTESDYDLSALDNEERELWETYRGRPPTLVLRCGITNCERTVGYVHSGPRGSRPLLVSLQNRPEQFRQAEYQHGVSDSLAQHLFTPEGVQLSEILASRRDYAERMTLKHNSDGTRNTKRSREQAIVMPLGCLLVYVCPDHGVFGLPGDTPGRVGEFLTRTTAETKRSFGLGRSATLGD